MPYDVYLFSDYKSDDEPICINMNFSDLVADLPRMDRYFKKSEVYITVSRTGSRKAAVTREQLMEAVESKDPQKVIDLFYHEDEFKQFVQNKIFRNAPQLNKSIPNSELLEGGIMGEFIYADGCYISQQLRDDYRYSIPLCNHIYDDSLLALEKILYRAYLADRHTISLEQRNVIQYLCPWVYRVQVKDCKNLEAFCRKYYKPELFRKLNPKSMENILASKRQDILYNKYAVIAGYENITGDIVTFIPEPPFWIA